MKVGIFGGTFDPVHLGHLISAEQCREQGRLDEVWFVPAPHPPHKAPADLTPFDRRADMIRLAIAGHPALRVSDIENQRPGPSYTADTLAELHRQQPQNDWHLIIGSDCLPDLAGWHEPLRIVAQATLLVVERPGWPVWPPEKLRAELRMNAADALRLQTVHVPLMEIASRDLRRRVSEGKSIRYLVPAAVAAYIAEKGLYT